MALLDRRPHAGTARLGVLVCMLLSASAQAQVFSPGPLARAHRHLEGLENCVKCHVAGDQLSAARCLDCHQEIDTRISSKRGFHGRLPKDQLQTCWQCHHDHKGVDFAVIPWGPKGHRGFEHERTGWPLLGEHAKTDCEKCHQKPRLSDAAIRGLVEKYPLKVTFLGLSSACASCHFDEHRGQVGPLCKSCHDEKAWDPAPLFDHQQDTDYPLEGAHKKVQCAECHPTLTDTKTPKDVFPGPKKQTYLQYAPVEHGSCLNCHEDPHEGRFGQRCEDCHTVKSWQDIRNAAKDRAFHEETRFPLKGAHQHVGCDKCHGPWPGQKVKYKGLAFSRCNDCHPDAHAGQLKLATATRGKTCDACHTEQGFKPTTYPVADHAKTRYPLTGAHEVVGCNQCHVQERGLAAKISLAVQKDLQRKKRQPLFSFALFDFKVPLEKCESCHADAHDGQLTSKKNGCASCHETASWRQLTFDHDIDSRYPLTGKHATTPCGSCHLPEKNKEGKTVVRYKPLPMECSGCHLDIHVGQLAEKPKSPTACEKCHTTEAFKPSPLFRHEPPFTAYLLDGRHRDVACAKCHPVLELGRGFKTARYKPLPQDCAGCHEDPHPAGFHEFAP